MSYGQTPSQTVGPFFHDALLHEAVDALDPQGVAGDPVRIEGRVIDGVGDLVTDAMIEIWQADGQGRYRHPADPRCDEVPEAFTGFGRLGTGKPGFRIDTAMPGAVSGVGDCQQAPHLNVQVFARGLLDKVSTRIYFDGHDANGADPILSTVPAHRRRTLLARVIGDRDGRTLYRFDIVLQGEGETVFFDI